MIRQLKVYTKGYKKLIELKPIKDYNLSEDKLILIKPIGKRTQLITYYE